MKAEMKHRKHLLELDLKKNKPIFETKAASLILYINQDDLT